MSRTCSALSDKVHAARSQVSETEYNQLSVRLELQADCLAGVWAHHADRSRQVVEPGDIDEALNAASQIGDDRLQQAGPGLCDPGFLHPRDLGPAGQMVPPGVRHRGVRQLRHLCRKTTLSYDIRAGII